MSEFRINGYHVAGLFGAAFAVIIGVNVTLAFNAVATFPGLETKNSYVASQSFDRDRAAQLGLGWDVSARIEANRLHLFVNTDDGPVVPVIESATLGRATHVGDDLTPAFQHSGAAFVADVGDLAAGNWNLRLVAVAEDGTRFRQRIVLRVAE